MKNKTFIILTIITILFGSIFTFAGVYIHDKKDLFANANRNKIVYTSNLITLKARNEFEKAQAQIDESEIEKISNEAFIELVVKTINNANWKLKCDILEKIILNVRKGKEVDDIAFVSDERKEEFLRTQQSRMTKKGRSKKS